MEHSTTDYPDVEPLLERSVDIAASVETVWQLLQDPCRLAEWSPTVFSSRYSEGESGPRVGARFTNRNRDGELEWTTHAVITRHEAPRALAFRIEENWAVWSFDLEPAAGGTRVTQTRRTPDGISKLSWDLTEGFMGGQAAFTTSLLEGMEETLRRIKVEAESDAG